MIQFFILLLFSVRPVSAQEAPDSFIFLNWNSVELGDIKPPQPGSAEDLADLLAVKKITKNRTDEACIQASADSHCSATSFFGGLYGPLPTDSTKKLEYLYWQVMLETDLFVNRLKGYYNRQRPYLRDNGITLCSATHDSSSFPSGHATIAQVSGLVFAQLFPSKSKRINARIKKIAHSRVVAGVHHPKDVAAGLLLGERIFKALMASHAFKARLEEARLNLLTPVKPATPKAKVKPVAVSH